MGITDIWTVAILRPMLNALLWLYSVLGAQFWLAIVVFTVFIRGLMTPLMLPQQRSAKKMQELQPRLQELQKKYGKDREKLSQEQMKLYREAGVNPMGGCLPMLVQFPIWIGLYQSIIQALGHQPLQLLGLSSNIYPFMQSVWLAIPLNRYFLGMDLSLTPQQRSAKKMQELQPRLQELQKMYGKDREQLSQEQMTLYREAGVNPLGGWLPMLVQFPSWIGL